MLDLVTFLTYAYILTTLEDVMEAFSLKSFSFSSAIATQGSNT